MAQLTGKEKRRLRAQANRLKAELRIGKEGLNEGTFQALENSFRTKVLVKIKVLETAPLDKQSIARELAQRSGAEVVQILGNTILLFRPLPEDARNPQSPPGEQT